MSLLVSNAKLPPHISLGHDGRLLLTGGAHGVIELFSSTGPGAPEHARDNFLSNLSNRIHAASKIGCSFSQWVFPDPIVFKGSLEDGKATSIFERAIPNYRSLSGLYYPLDMLNGHPERHCRTDTHYSALGNLHLASRTAEISLKIDTRDLVSDIESKAKLIKGVTGDLGRVCDPVVREDRKTIPQLDGIIESTNGLANGNNGIVNLITSPNSITRRTLLIFGDSFFRSLRHDLSRWWRNIVFLRTPYFHHEMIKAVSPDDILCGMAERYYPSCNLDSTRPHFLSYPLMHGRASNPDSEFSNLWKVMIDAQALASPW